MIYNVQEVGSVPCESRLQGGGGTRVDAEVSTLEEFTAIVLGHERSLRPGREEAGFQAYSGSRASRICWWIGQDVCD